MAPRPEGRRCLSNAWPGFSIPCFAPEVVTDSISCAGQRAVVAASNAGGEMGLPCLELANHESHAAGIEKHCHRIAVGQH